MKKYFGDADLVKGVAEVIEQLSKRLPLAVVSDAIVSPGKDLKRILEHHDVARFFQGFAFSDELGHSKPHRAMFASAADRPNIVMYFIDDLGWTDVSFMGSKYYETPHVDRLARE